MIQITFADNKFKTERKGFVQYDYGQKVLVSGLDFEDDELIFQFIKNGKEGDTLGTKTLEGYVVEIPNQFLETAGSIAMYAFYETETVGNSVNCAVFDILPREKYTPVPPEEYEDIIATIFRRLGKAAASALLAISVISVTFGVNFTINGFLQCFLIVALKIPSFCYNNIRINI